MNFKKFVVATCIYAIPSAGSAFNYAYLEGGYLDYEREAGLRVAASLPMTSQLAAFAEVSDAGKIEQLAVGVLFHQALNARVDWIVGTSLESVELARDDDTGLGLRAGLRMKTPEPALEISPEIRHRMLFDDGATSLRVSGLYHLNAPISIQLALQGGDEDVFELGVRYAF